MIAAFEDLLVNDIEPLLSCERVRVIIVRSAGAILRCIRDIPLPQGGVEDFVCVTSISSFYALSAGNAMAGACASCAEIAV